MKRFHNLLFLLIVFVWVTTSSNAIAQTDEENELARRHFDEGAAKYNGGKYAESITGFQKAFAVVPNGLFLYNISLAQGKLGLFSDARATALKAVQHPGMDPKTTTRNQARIPAFTTVIDATDIALEIAAISKLRQQNEDDKKPKEPQIIEEKRFGAVGYTGVALAVIGTGGLVFSAILANGISSDIPEYENAAANGNSLRYNELKGDLQDRQTLGVVALGVGGLLAAVGVTLILIDVLNTETTTTTVYILPTARGANAGLKLTF